MRKRIGDKSQLKKNEMLDVRIHAYGPLEDRLHLAQVPTSLPQISRKVAKIAVGEKHCLFLFGKDFEVLIL